MTKIEEIMSYVVRELKKIGIKKWKETHDYEFMA